METDTEYDTVHWQSKESPYAGKLNYIFKDKTKYVRLSIWFYRHLLQKPGDWRRDSQIMLWNIFKCFMETQTEALYSILQFAVTIRTSSVCLLVAGGSSAGSFLYSGFKKDYHALTSPVHASRNRQTLWDQRDLVFSFTWLRWTRWLPSTGIQSSTAIFVSLWASRYQPNIN